MSTFGVHSEVGKLRKVMVHRPELSLQRLTPSTHDELLFDDVLWVERAQYEHDQFQARMRERGVEVFVLRDLLAAALAARRPHRRPPCSGRSPTSWPHHAQTSRPRCCDDQLNPPTPGGQFPAVVDTAIVSAGQAACGGSATT